MTAKGLDVFTGEERESIFQCRTTKLPFVIQTYYAVQGIDKDKGEATLANKFEGSQRTLALPQGDLGDMIKKLWDEGVGMTVTVTEASWTLAAPQTVEEIAITSVQRKD